MTPERLEEIRAKWKSVPSHDGDDVRELIAALAAEREAVRVLADLAYRTANRDRLIEMDPDLKSREVSEEKLSNAAALLRVQGVALNNPIVKAAIKAAQEKRA